MYLDVTIIDVGVISLFQKGIRHESENWGFESSSGRDIFCI